MKALFSLLATTLLASGCSTPPPVATVPPPESVLGTWEFTVSDKDGPRNPVIRLTETPSDTCISGDWFQAKVVSADGLKFSDPTYTYSDGRLEVLLTSGLCDAYTSFIGTVSGTQFNGAHVSYGLFGSTEHGKVVGARRP